MNQEINKRQLQAMKTKDRIFTSAIKLFFTKGYDSVTIEQICSNAGVSKGLFYNYFTTKDEVLISVFNEVEDLYRNMRNLFSPSDTSMERLILCTEKIVLHVINSELRKESVRIVYINSLKNPDSNNILMREDREFFHIINEIIEYGQQRGEIRTDLRREEIRDYIVSHIFGCYLLWMTSPEFEILSEIRNHVILLFSGIGIKNC